MKSSHRHQKLVNLSQAGMIAAMYVALTFLSGPLASGAIQLRLSEALCVLPLFYPAAIPGLALGCFLANLLTGCLWQDMVFGTLATLIGALGAYALRKIPALVPLPTVLANTLIVPFVLAYAYGAEEGVPVLMLTVGIGEFLSAYLLGTFLLSALRRIGGGKSSTCRKEEQHHDE